MNQDGSTPLERSAPPPADLPDLHAAGFGQVKLAAHYGVTRHRVRRWLRELGLSRPKGGGSKLPLRTDWPPPKALLASLIYNYPVRDIAERYGVANNSVKYWLDQYEIPIAGAYRDTMTGPRERIPPPPMDTLVEEYVVKRRNAEDLAREHEVSSHVIAKWLGEYEIPVFSDNHTNSRTARAYRERRRTAMPDTDEGRAALAAPATSTPDVPGVAGTPSSTGEEHD